MAIALKVVGAITISGIMMKSPLWSLYTLIIVLPFMPNESMIILSALLVFSFIVKMIIDGNSKFVKDPLTIPIIAFMIIQIIATVTSVTPILSLKNLVVSLVAFALYFVIINTIETKEELDRVIKVFIVTAVSISIYGILQYFTLGATSSAWVDLEMNPDLKTRVVGTFGNPNVFAEYLEHILPLAIAMVFVYKKWLNKLIMFFLAGIMFVCLILTSSRGAWLGFAGAALFFLVLKLSRYIILFILGGFLSYPFIPSVVLQRIKTIGNIKDTSNQYRTFIWEGTINMIKDFWVTGIGYGYWAFKNTFYEYGIRGSKAWHSHNMYLEITAEMGVFGILIFIWVILSCFFHGIKFLINTEDKYLSYLTTGLLAGLFSVMIHGIAEHILYMPKSVILFWIFLAFISSARIVGDKLESQS